MELCPAILVRAEAMFAGSIRGSCTTDPCHIAPCSLSACAALCVAHLHDTLLIPPFLSVGV
eukprot:869008-Pelagomonas_calceolata.AAC.1